MKCKQPRLPEKTNRGESVNNPASPTADIIRADSSISVGSDEFY